MGETTNPNAERERSIERDLVGVSNLPPGVDGPVTIARTHGSIVFLAAADVFKLKRSVDLGFFDFSTIEARETDCHAEVALNRRAAPDVYLDVLPVFEDAEGFSLTRSGGEVVDYVVHMRRLPDELSVAARLTRNELSAADLDRLAGFVADFYRSVAIHESASEAMRQNIVDNFEQSESFVGSVFDRDRFEQLRALHTEWHTAHASLLAARETRDGHGDLRLEHAYLLPAGPALIDCISFNDSFRIADPALDVAFFAMELRREGREDFAESFCSAFAYEFDDYDSYPLIDGYVSYRAMVRAKIAAIVAAGSGDADGKGARKVAEARRHFDLAFECFEPRPSRPRVLAVGGLPASGKSTVARRLRHRHAAVVVSADATRKHLAGVAKAESADESAYTPEFSSRVQAELLRRARCVVESGRDVVLDTTFRRRADRDAARAFAADCGADFVFVECVAPDEVLRARIRARTGDVSDADESVLDAFLRDHDPVEELPAAQLVRIDTDVASVALDAAVDRQLAGATSQ